MSGEPAPEALVLSEVERLVLELMADRWSVLVLGAICTRRGVHRFNALKREIPGIAQKTLTQCLRKLERNGIVTRQLIDSRPPGVEYHLTPLGASLGEPFSALRSWIGDHATAIRQAQADFDRREAERGP